MNPTFVFLKYEFKRLFNTITSGKKTSKRMAHAKRSFSLTICVSFFMFLLIALTSWSITIRTNNILGRNQIINGQKFYPAWVCPSKKSKDKSIRCEPVPTGDSLVTTPVKNAVNLIILSIFLCVLLLNIAQEGLLSNDWDLEKFSILPIPLSKLIKLKILGNVVINPNCFLIIWPSIVGILRGFHFGFSSFLIGLGICILISFIEVLFRFITTIGLNILFPISTLKNLQALIPIAIIAVLIPVFSILGEKAAVLQLSTSPFIDWLQWTPIGLIFNIITTSFIITETSTIYMLIISILCLIIQLFLIYFLITKLFVYLFRFGITINNTHKISKNTITTSSFTKPSFLSPIQWRELILLKRDRTFLMQTLVIPIFIGGFYYFTDDQYTTFLMIGINVAIYFIYFAIFKQILNSEGQSLWLLYTMPKDLIKIFKEKAKLWISITLLALIIFLGINIIQTTIYTNTIVIIAMQLVGVVLFGVIAASMGILASNPLAENPKKNINTKYKFLFMYFAMYYYGIINVNYWNKLAIFVTIILTAIALWQKAKQNIHYLLDPSKIPNPRIDISDGLIAVSAFQLVRFFIDRIVKITEYFSQGNFKISAEEIVKLFEKSDSLAFFISGIIVMIALEIIYFKKKTIGIPKFFGRNPLKSIGYGIPCAFCLLISYVLYKIILYKYDPNLIPLNVPSVTLWSILSATIAAPIFEEFIFRGILFKGVFRSWSLPVAILASSAIFAVGHGELNIINTFLLGMILAFSYYKTKTLITPIIAHAIYNLVISLYLNDITNKIVSFLN